MSQKEPLRTQDIKVLGTSDGIEDDRPSGPSVEVALWERSTQLRFPHPKNQGKLLCKGTEANPLRETQGLIECYGIRFQVNSFASS